MNLRFNRSTRRVQKMLIPAYVSSVILIFSFITPKTYANDSALAIDKEWALPMIEISGLSMTGDSLCAISDNEHEMLKLPMSLNNTDEIKESDSEFLDLDTNVPSQEQAQWEAVSVNDGSGIFVMKESESRIFQFDKEGRQLKAYNLLPWHGRTDPDRGYEGLMLLQNGHFLVALETATAALIEYGPEGDAPVGFSLENRTTVAFNERFIPAAATDLVPLAAWTMKGGEGDCKFSDLAQAEDGGILVLEKGCLKIAHVAKLNPTKTTFSPDQSWDLPADIEHPEGLQALPGGRFLVASDIKTKVSNLYLLKTAN